MTGVQTCALPIYLLSGSIGWGYRNEIYVGAKSPDDEMLEVGTLEYFLWDPVYEDEKKTKKVIADKNGGRTTEKKRIIGVEPITYTLAFEVFGIER